MGENVDDEPGDDRDPDSVEIGTHVIAIIVGEIKIVIFADGMFIN